MRLVQKMPELISLKEYLFANGVALAFPIAVIIAMNMSTENRMIVISVWLFLFLILNCYSLMITVSLVYFEKLFIPPNRLWWNVANINPDVFCEKTVQAWCSENLQGKWVITKRNNVLLQKTEDTIYFKLVWS